jgi:hypothetical protein
MHYELSNIIGLRLKLMLLIFTDGHLTIDINALQQDHPCLIDAIRRGFLQFPAPPGTPLNLDHPEVVDPSAIQSKVILSLLQNKVIIFK